VKPDGSETALKDHPLLFAFFGKIQEEVHRFAVEYHRGLRKKKAIHSVLDEVPGIGAKRRQALMLAFGSVDRIGEATEEELAKVPGMNKKSAEAVAAFFLADAETK
jgi:excinuclease ABC subunit C